MQPRPPSQMTGPPKSLFPYVEEFCRSIAPDAAPIFMTPSYEPADKPVECVDNVRRRIAVRGGEPVFGWKIWEWHGVMIEAEFHTVWRTKEGALKDVTPNALPFDRILFLPDTSLVYREKQIENIRRPLISDRRIKEFINTASAEFALLNEGERADKFEISLSKEEGELLKRLQIKRAQLGREIDRTPPRRNELCRCGGGRKYKHCCAKISA